MNLIKLIDLDKILTTSSSLAMFIESNPSPVKYAASLLGLCLPRCTIAIS